MKKTFIIASNTFKDAIRQKLILLIAFIAVLLAALANYLLKLDLGHEQLRFIFDFGSGALSFFGAIIAVVASCQLIHSELENKTVMTLLSKPASLGHFVFGKFLGVCLILAIFTLIITSVSGAMCAYTYGQLASRSNAANLLHPNYFGMAVYAVLQWAKLSAIAAMACMVCSVSTSLMFSILISFTVLAGTMMRSASLWMEVGDGIALKFAGAIFPNLEFFSKAEAFAFAPIDWGISAAAIIYALVYVFASCFVSTWLFGKREF